MTRRAVGLVFGPDLPAWEPKILWAGPFFAVLSPLFYGASLLGDPDPARFFVGALGAASYVVIGVQVALFAFASALIAARRAMGLVWMNLGFFYVAMIVNALGIAWIALASWQAGVFTIALVAWSGAALLRINAGVGADPVRRIRAEMVSDGAMPVLRSPGAVPDGGTARAVLADTRSGLATLAEFAGVGAMFLIGPGLIVPLGISGGFSQSGILAWILWAVCCAIFLAGRGIANTWLLYARAMRGAF